MQQGSSVNRYNGDGALVQTDRVAYTQDLASSLSKVLQINDGTDRTNYIYGHERLLSDAAGGEWYATDALGSLRFTLDGDGLATSGTTYDPFGQRERGTIATFGFTGELQDTESGNIYLRARWYNPSHGAFMAQDPFSGFDTLPYSLHPYQYAYSNPTLYTDPSGRCIPEGVPFIGEQDCSLSAGIGQGNLDIVGLKEYSADIVLGMGILGAIIADAMFGTNGTEEIMRDADIGTYLGIGIFFIASGGALRYANQLSIDAAVRAQIYINSHPELIPVLAGLGLMANVSDDILLWTAALCNDPFAANEIYTAQYFANLDGAQPFGDVVAAGVLSNNWFQKWLNKKRLRANPPGQGKWICQVAAVSCMAEMNTLEFYTNEESVDEYLKTFPYKTGEDGKQYRTNEKGQQLLEFRTSFNHFAVRNPDGTITDAALRFNFNSYAYGVQLPPDAERLLKYDTFSQEEHDYLMSLLTYFVENPGQTQY